MAGSDAPGTDLRRPTDTVDLLSQDYIQIGGEKSPGKATILAAGRKRGWEIRKGIGLSGATIAPTGDELATFTVRFEFFDEPRGGLSTSQQLDAWFAFSTKWFSKTAAFVAGKARALGIWHPILAAPPLQIIEAVVSDLGQLEQDDYGGWSCEVKFLEYRKALAAPDKPIAAIPAAAQPAPTAEDEADREMADKFATFRRLGEAARPK